MIEFGKTLKAAREAKGLTIGQVAELTRMMTAMVQDLENEDFSRLAAPIYGRGFVKLYCEAVGLDPKPMIAEFMDLYNGNREPTIRERPVPAEPQTEETAQEPVIVATAPEAVQTQTLFDAPAPAAEPSEPTLSRYQTPVREPLEPRLTLSPVIWRKALIALAVVVLLFLIWTGLTALYRATSAKTPTPTASEPAPQTIERTPQDIPPLYID